jgi:hypothetical protein
MIRARIGMLVIGLFPALFGCGLDGVSGQLVKIEQNIYVVKTPNGTEYVLHVDDRTRKDSVAPGDRVHAYIAKDGHAAFLQRLDP